MLVFLQLLERMHAAEPPLPRRVVLRLRRSARHRQRRASPMSSAEINDETAADAEAERVASVAAKKKKKLAAAAAGDAGDGAIGDDDEWLEDLAVDSRSIITVNKQLVDRVAAENVTTPMARAWIQIDATKATE